DTLILEFKDTFKKWSRVWAVTGTKSKPFKQILQGIIDGKYLGPDFQFRFVNYTKNTGNLNQWHLDYIRINRARNRYDTIVEDLAINKVPGSALQNYNVMPYDHLLADYNNERAPQIKLAYRNNFNTTKNVTLKYDAYNRYGNKIGSTSYNTINNNVLPNSDTFENLPNIRFDTLSGKKPIIRFVYKMSEKDPGLVENPIIDKTPSDYYNSVLDTNNTITYTQRFDSYFAYDDGSAEGGFGLDYASLPPGPGYIAYKFRMNKADTLRGISIFFNQSVADVSTVPFDLILWKDITAPPSTGMGSDKIIYRIPVYNIKYTDTINGFQNFVFDTTIVLPQGNFYIGWQQNTNYILNVGFDNNYRYNGNNVRNPNIYYNLVGDWQAISPNIQGAIMMRPLIGEVVKDLTSVKQTIFNAKSFSIYPNPSEGSINIDAGQINPVNVEVFDVFGRKIYNSKDKFESIDLSGFSNGNYIIKLTDILGVSYIQKCIKTD
ncbi:MAG: T9SS type A sorting domain-containing protein, partial [Bacteroidia bacterium]|nr:T9SS type A sorting domain-containing protein [Bacteroidia bacterium]